MTPLERVREDIQKRIEMSEMRRGWDVSSGFAAYTAGYRNALSETAEHIDKLLSEAQATRATPRCPVEFEEGEG